jgi:UDP-N-acetylmuramoyl-tripeptide--D-alanyl-D-alanine ligase
MNMETRTLKYLAEACHGELCSGSPDAPVQRISTDSRTASEGEVFLAIKGERLDGHAFAETVISRGVAGVVIRKDHPLPSPSRDVGIVRVSDTRSALGLIAARYRQDFDLPVIAVAGSNGKTSTKELLASVLRQKFPVLWSEASFNNDVGVPLTLLRLESSHQAAILEAGTNHPGELAPLIRIIDPQIGVMTSIGREHLEFFGDLEGVLKEEGVLADLLPENGFLFLNGDCEGADRIAARSRATVIRAGLEPGNPWRAENIRYQAGRQHFDLQSPDGHIGGEFEIQMLGRAQVGNAVLAAAVGAHLGLNRQEIADGLRDCRPAKMRMELLEFSGVRILNDAYNANADSTRVALVTMAELPVRGRRIVVLGDMAELGEHTHAAHLEVGRLAAELEMDQLIAVGRFAEVTARAARDSGMSDVRICRSADAAGALLSESVRPDDLVLLKGSRTSRLEQILDYLGDPLETAT